MNLNRLVWLPLLCVTTIAAGCGRTSLKPRADGGGSDSRLSDAGGADAGNRDGGLLPDGAARPDGAVGDAVADGARDVGLIDGQRPVDGSLDAVVGRDGAADGQARPDGANGDGGIGTGGDTAPAMLVGIDLSPALAKAAAGTSVTFLATGRFSDGTTRDLTTVATWTSSAPAVASVAGGVTSALLAGSADIKAAVMNLSATATLTVTAATLTAVNVEPVSAQIPVSTKQAFKAAGTFSDGTKQDVTGQVTWSSSDITVAVVGADGTVSGLHPGMVTVAATLMGITGKSDVTVTSATVARLEVSPANPTVNLPGMIAFIATAVYSDGSNGDITTQVTWESSDRTILNISSAAGSQGQAVSVAPGTAIVTARLGVLNANTTVTVSKAALVSIQVTPANVMSPKGTTQAFVAMGTYSDASMADITSSVAWTAADGTVASVSNGTGTQGVATALGVGATDIVATLGGVSGSTKLTVSSATVVSVAVVPKTISVAIGLQTKLTATATFSDGSTKDVTDVSSWSVADATVADVSNVAGSAGQVTAFKLGSTDVTASYQGKTDSSKVTVSNATLNTIVVKPATATLAAGLRQNFTASGSYSDGSTLDLTTQVTWSTEDATVATVSNAVATPGLLTAVGAGATNVHAKLSDKDGSAAITVTTPALATLSISPLLPTRRVGDVVQFGASAVSTNGTSLNVTLSATWASSNPAVASIGTTNQRGQARCVARGTTTISATYMGASDSTTLTCTDPVLTQIQVTPFTANLLVGAQQNFAASALFSDGSSRDVTFMATWSSSDPKIADVTNAMRRGIVAGISGGMATITATYMGLSATSTVMVSSAVLTSLSVSPVTATVRVNQTQGFQATGIYSDGTTRNLTGMTTWSSSDRSIADISNIGGRGQATGLKAGSVTITATFQGLTDAGTLTVTAFKLTGISISPVSANILVGQTQGFQATAIFDDGSTQAVTGQSLWGTSDATVADVSNGAAKGQATGIKAGTVTISASYLGFTDVATLSVSGATVTGISVSPITVSLRVGQTQGFQATALFSDGTTQNVTFEAAWTSSNPKVADVTNTGGRGQVTGLTAGSAVITAKFMNMSDTASVNVAAVTITSISVTPLNPTVAINDVTNFQAVAIYSDGSNSTVTGQATWSSADPTVADISNGINRGQTTALKAGTSKITATLQGVSGNSTLTVSGATLAAIQVTPINASLSKGAAQQYQAVGIYSDGTTRTITAQVTWLSSDETVVVVSNANGSRGQASALAAGTATVSAQLGTTVGKTNVTVSSATVTEIQVTPTNPVVLVGGTQQFTATAVFSDFTVQNVTNLATWSFDKPAVADVSNAAGTKGRATGITSGTGTVTATFMLSSGSSGVTVTSATIKEIQVVPANASTPVGVKTQFTATAVLTDNSTLDVTGTATWTSLDETVATISNVGATHGQATALKPGVTTIRATLDGSSGTTTFTVGSQLLSTISVTPAAASLAKNGTLAFTATGTYDNASTFDLTPYVTWISTASNVAAVSNAALSHGLVTGVAAGSTNIEAHLDTKVGSTTLTVTP